MTTNRPEGTRRPCEPVTGRPAERHEGSRNGPVAFPGSGRPDRDTVSVLDVAVDVLVPDADTQPDRGDDEPSVVAGHHHHDRARFPWRPGGGGSPAAERPPFRRGDGRPGTPRQNDRRAAVTAAAGGRPHPRMVGRRAGCRRGSPRRRRQRRCHGPSAGLFRAPRRHNGGHSARAVGPESHRGPRTTGPAPRAVMVKEQGPPDRSPMPPGGIVDPPITSNGHRVRPDREMRSHASSDLDIPWLQISQIQGLPGRCRRPMLSCCDPLDASR